MKTCPHCGASKRETGLYLEVIQNIFGEFVIGTYLYKNPPKSSSSKNSSKWFCISYDLESDNISSTRV